MKKEERQEAFTEEFGIHFKGSSGELGFALSFIEDLLDKQKQEIMEEIERIINDDDKDSIRIDDTPSYIRIDARERLFNLKTHINQVLTK